MFFPASMALVLAAQWGWPLAGEPRPVRYFAPPAERWLSGHRGVDLPAVPGQEVLASGEGVVTVARRVAGRGVVTVTHPNGLRTTYLPVDALVSEGRRVRAGEVLGTVGGPDGHCPAVCLHWGLVSGDLYLDPLLLMGLGQVRLLPLGKD
ncbi:M23 family metallopeptidase [Herbidospora daliensis]|uniref:M23 family metallopeptidase n=1 Tax=Herbidospora daliensis TaxID=295585 RepID=UPI000AD1F403|nr:M23 family metallopeptidase [Herbidospora daliensis]